MVTITKTTNTENDGLVASRRGCIERGGDAVLVAVTLASAGKASRCTECGKTSNIPRGAVTVLLKTTAAHFFHLMPFDQKRQNVKLQWARLRR